MLSSLIALIKALRQSLSELLAPAPASGPAAPPGVGPAACPDPLCGVVEMSYRRDSGQGLQTQAVWIRVDTRKLMERILQNPDINLDALQGIERRGGGLRAVPAAAASTPAAKAQAPAWHQKVRCITQAPPARPSAGRRRVPPPPTHH